MTEFENILRKVATYRAKRGWEKNRKPKDLAMLFMLEAADFLQDAGKGKDFEKKYRAVKKTVTEELAAALYWVFFFCNQLDIDIVAALEKKVREKEKKPRKKKRR